MMSYEFLNSLQQFEEKNPTTGVVVRGRAYLEREAERQQEKDKKQQEMKQKRQKIEAAEAELQRMREEMDSLEGR